MDSQISALSSLKEDGESSGNYIQPHYKESYRLAIYALINGGRDSYHEYLKAEKISDFLSEEEIIYITENAELPVMVVEDEDDSKVKDQDDENDGQSTYFPTESDEEVPDLDLGWPDVSLENMETNISLLFHPPRHNNPSIKEVIRKQMQEARQVIAIAMDIFTDVDIFKELVNATVRGVMVYILLDDHQFKTFLNMTKQSGVNIHDLNNMRVRTVQGHQYQCQSGAKFHGGLEQRFLLVDCKTVVYGTYSYMWSYEKINLSMVLVITGQLAGSYDEEFRRIFARSQAPPTVTELRKNSITNSQLSLDMLNMKSRGRLLSMRSTTGLYQDEGDRFNNGRQITRGLSIQDRLQHIHRPEVGNLTRGHSYAGELHQRTQLRQDGQDQMLANRVNQFHHKQNPRFGTEQSLLPYSSETSLHRWKIDSFLNYSNQSVGDSVESLNLSQPDGTVRQTIGSSRLRSSMIFNNRRDERPESPGCNQMPQSTIGSPHGSQSGLAESRLRRMSTQGSQGSLADSRMRLLSTGGSQHCLTEMRQRLNSIHNSQTDLADFRSRLSQSKENLSRAGLQDYKNPGGHLRPGQSQDCLRSVYSSLDRAMVRPMGRTLEQERSISYQRRGSDTGSNTGSQHSSSNMSQQSHVTPAGQRHEENTQRGTEREQVPMSTPLTDAHRSVSHYDLHKMASEKRYAQEAYDWQKPLSRTASAAHLGIKLKEPLLKPSSFRPVCLNVDTNRTMMSLIGIPEGSTDQLNDSADSLRKKDASPLQRVNSFKSSTRLFNPNSDGSLDKDKAQQEEGITGQLQRQGSFKSKVTNLSVFIPDAQNTQPKEEPPPPPPPVVQSPIQRSSSSSMYYTEAMSQAHREQQAPQRPDPIKPVTPLVSQHVVAADISIRQRVASEPVIMPSLAAAAPVSAPMSSLGQATSVSHNVLSIERERERHILYTPTYTPTVTPTVIHQSAPSTRTFYNTDQELLNRARVMESQVPIIVPEPRRTRVYSRFESFLSSDKKPTVLPERTNTDPFGADKNRLSFRSTQRRPSITSTESYSRFQQTNENKLGRFMQRVGNLIGKNK